MTIQTSEFVEVQIKSQELTRDSQEWQYKAYLTGGGTSRVGTPDGAVIVDTRPPALNTTARIVLDEADNMWPDKSHRTGIPTVEITWIWEDGKPKIQTWALNSVDRALGGQGFGEYTRNLEVPNRTDVGKETIPFIKRALDMATNALELPARPTKITEGGQAPMDFFVNEVNGLRQVIGQLRAGSLKDI